jgi:hypothetical protein
MLLFFKNKKVGKSTQPLEQNYNSPLEPTIDERAQFQRFRKAIFWWVHKKKLS